jgi:hypothetical protein
MVAKQGKWYDEWYRTTSNVIFKVIANEISYGLAEFKEKALKRVMWLYAMEVVTYDRVDVPVDEAIE